jgi:beta-glucanase (GH16 family)
MRHSMSLTRARKLAVALACLVTAGALLVPSDSVSAAAPICGGEHPTGRPGGGTWTCTFHDEFNATSLNRNVWVVQTTAQAGWHSGNECAIDSPHTVSEGGGLLSLTVRRTPTFTCADPYGNFRTDVIGGSIFTRTFAQSQGRFEIRAKFAPSNAGKSGIQGALWLYPANVRSSTGMTGPTEIDIAEHYSVHPNLVIPTVHSYMSLTGYSNYTCNVVGAETGFHTYTAIWSASAITIQYDGHTCLNLVSPFAGSTAGPFLVALSQSVGTGADAPSAATPMPATEQVDYVRVWR